MASPLGWFRRHQKGMMVVFGMVLMAIFGLGSVAMLINNPTQSTDPSANKVIVKWDGGKLKKSQVESLRIRHYQTGRFIRTLEDAARQVREGQFRSVAIPIAWLRDNMPVRDADFAIAQRYILAERAKQAGIVVSDTMVDDYISLCHNLVDFAPGDYEQINRDANGEYSDLVNVRSHLKMELAAQQYRILLNTGLPTSLSPTEAAEYNSRMEKTIECTVLAFDVNDFLDDVKEKPSNSELKKIFEEGRYKPKDPTGTEPGFKQPKRVRINYVEANFNDLLTAEKLKISDQQVQEEYAKLVKEEDSLVMELVPPVEPENPDGGNDAPTPEDGDNGNDAPKPSDDDDAAPKPPTDDESSDKNAEKDGESAEKSDDESGEKKEENNSQDGDDDLSSLSTGAQFVSTVQDEEKKDQEKTEEQSGQENTESAKDDAKKAEADGNQSDENQTGDDQSSDDQEQTEEPKMLDEQEGENDPTENDQTENDLLPGEGGQDLDQTPILTRPKKLDEALSDLIRGRMVSETAFREMRRVIVEAEEEVREQQYDYAEWDNQTDQEKKNTEPPITLELVEMADRLGLQYGETELLSYDELLENAGFGARDAIVSVQTRFGAQNSRRKLADLVFASLDRKSNYEPGSPVVEFATQSNILWWPVEIRETEILEFAEAKEQVVEFWRREKARELALAKAKEIAETLNSNGKRLIEFSKTAENTGNFTWYLNGLVKPKGVEDPGEEFMDTAFGLSMNECGAALNANRDYAYVIQNIFQDTRSSSEIAGTFLDNWAKFQMVPPTVADTADREYQYLRRAAQFEVNEEMNVQWVAE